MKIVANFGRVLEKKLEIVLFISTHLKKGKKLKKDWKKYVENSSLEKIESMLESKFEYVFVS